MAATTLPRRIFVDSTVTTELQVMRVVAGRRLAGLAVMGGNIAATIDTDGVGDSQTLQHRLLHRGEVLVSIMQVRGFILLRIGTGDRRIGGMEQGMLLQFATLDRGFQHGAEFGRSLTCRLEDLLM